MRRFSVEFWRLFLVRNRKLILIISPIILLVITGAVVWFIAGSKMPEPLQEAPPPTPEPPQEVPHLLNGVLVSPELQERRVVAVMIENSPAARPQIGLTSADVVYEAVTEGGITRFMALYSQLYPTKAGPVRSARSYFLDWASEFDAFYAHAGGSPTALKKIGEYSIKAYPHSNDAYWREPRRGVASEHTLFVDAAKIFQFGVEKRGWPATHTFASLPFKDGQAGGLAQSVTVNFSTNGYQTTWQYQPETGLYLRSMASQRHLDRDSGQQIAVKTLIVQTVNRTPNPSYSSGRESEWTMQTLGSGPASIFQDGQRIDGTWRKDSRTARTKFFDGENQEIQLVRGKLWYAIVPQTGTISVAELPAS